MGRLREQDTIRERVSAYLDGELPPEDAAYVGRQIQDDPAYAQVYGAYRGIRMDMRALAHPEVPPAVSQAIRARAATMQPRRPVLNIRQRVARVTAAAATLVATFAALLTGGFGLQNHFSHVAPGNGTSPTTISVWNAQTTTATILNPNIRYDQPAEIRFTRPMNEQTVKTSVLFTPGVAVANLQYDKAQNILSTKPKTLLPDTQYVVTIPSGLKDADGNAVEANSFSFSVSAITPGIANPPAATAITTPTPLAIAALPTVSATSAAVTTADATAPNATPATVATTETTATEAPAAPTAVTNAVPVAPRPTNTPVPAPKPQGTTIAIVAPTAIPTAAPTVAPTATAVPTVAPTATTPAIAVADKFKGAYASLANRLGAPTGPASGVQTSQLFFQNGFMLYVAGQPIYIFYSGDRTWTGVANPGNSGAGSDGGPGPSGSLYKPARAFGVVWTAQNLQSRLGYATAPNESGGSGTIQSFEGGTILSVGGDVYVLLKNGTWQPFSG